LAAPREPALLEFKEYWSGLVEMAKAAGQNAGDLIRYGLPAVRQHTKSQEEILKYIKIMRKILDFMNEEQIKLFFSFPIAEAMAKRILRSPFEIRNRYAVIAFLLEFSLTNNEKNQVLIKVH
jgi:hypothetical protein